MFMRHQAGGVRKSTSRQLVLREFGCRPLVGIWVQSMVSLWNCVVASRDDCLLKIAMLEGTSLGGNCSWYSGFLSVLSRFGGAPEAGLCPYGVPVSLPMRDTLLAFDAWFYSGWRDNPADPRTAEQGTFCKYRQWFATQGTPFLTLLRFCQGQVAGNPAICSLYCGHQTGPAACADMFQAVSTFSVSENHEVGQAPAAPG
jgi:hypothetical protein